MSRRFISMPMGLFQDFTFLLMSLRFFSGKTFFEFYFIHWQHIHCIISYCIIFLGMFCILQLCMWFFALSISIVLLMSNKYFVFWYSYYTFASVSDACLVRTTLVESWSHEAIVFWIVVSSWRLKTCCFLSFVLIIYFILWLDRLVVSI